MKLYPYWTLLLLLVPAGANADCALVVQQVQSLDGAANRIRSLVDTIVNWSIEHKKFMSNNDIRRYGHGEKAVNLWSLYRSDVNRGVFHALTKDPRYLQLSLKEREEIMSGFLKSERMGPNTPDLIPLIYAERREISLTILAIELFMEWKSGRSPRSWQTRYGQLMRRLPERYQLQGFGAENLIIALKEEAENLEISEQEIDDFHRAMLGR